MAQITYRANLSAKSFPFLSENFGRSVMVGQYDNNFVRQVVSPEDQDKDIGIPQLYYCHNVMPASSGFQSVGYTDILPPIPGVTDIVKIFTIRDVDANTIYLGIRANGDFYVNDGSGGAWVYKLPGIAGRLVTVAAVSGVSYIYIERNGCYTYNFGTGGFDWVVLTGLDMAQVVGITQSTGYMIAWTKNTVAWSSTIDPTDFVPDSLTGAGGGGVEEVKGAINYCIPHTLGFIIGSADNCVAAIAQSNARYPFQYRELVSSGGLTDLDLISYDANSSGLYAYTTSGMQLISIQQTQTVFPELTDFISGRYFEDFDDSTKTFTHSTISSPLKKAVSIVADRYLVISYGLTELTHAIVYDLVMKRYGKLKETHVKAFTYSLPASSIMEAPRQSFGLLKADGSVVVVDFSVASATSNGTAILGKYQFVRSRLLQLDTIEVESIRPAQTLALTVMTALDGKNTVNSTPAALYTGGLTREFGCRAVGINHSLLFQGGFMLNSLVLQFHVHGKR